MSDYLDGILKSKIKPKSNAVGNNGEPGRVNSPDSEQPEINKEAFACPNCQAYAHQTWQHILSNTVFNTRQTSNLNIAKCVKCNAMSVWVNQRIVYPACSAAPMPTADMPEDVKADYFEARDVFEKSPRSAGGLLRLGLEKLTIHLGEATGDLNARIGNLVKKGLALGTQQQALDILRIFANQSAHNGFVKLEDQPETVGFLFKLMNHIVEQLITRPNQIDAMFKGLPPDKLAGIEKRDGKK